MTLEEKQQLRKGLRQYHGAFTEVARRCECTLSFVMQVFNGHRNSEYVLAQAAKLLRERTEEKARLEQEAVNDLKAAIALAQQPS